MFNRPSLLKHRHIDGSLQVYHAYRIFVWLCTTVFDDFVDSGRMLGSKHLLSAIYALGSSDYPRSCDKFQGIHSTVHSSTGCERISDLSVNITHVIPTLDLRRCSPAASAIGGLVLARRLPATGAVGSARRPRRAAGAAGGQPVGGKPA